MSEKTISYSKDERYRQIVKIEESGFNKKGTKTPAMISTTMHQVKNGEGKWVKTTKTGRGFRKPMASF